MFTLRLLTNADAKSFSLLLNVTIEASAFVYALDFDDKTIGAVIWQPQAQTAKLLYITILESHRFKSYGTQLLRLSLLDLLINSHNCKSFKLRLRRTD